MNFREKVYEVVSKIPKGQVLTYKQVAIAAGKPNAARVVGYFMKTNPYAPQVPCHRVIRSDGKIGGFSGNGGIDGKRRMLEEEGILFTKKWKVVREFDQAKI